MEDGLLWKLKTPCYVINVRQFESNIKSFRDAFVPKWKGLVELGYSIKTNHNKALLEIAKENDMYAEAVSDDEYRIAEASGYLPPQIICNGPQKSAEIVKKVIREGGVLNVDNWCDIEFIRNNLQQIPPKYLEIGIRVNFNLEYNCPGETTAGQEVSRFGFCVENGDFALAIMLLRQMGLQVNGLHMHYSTKSRSTAVFKALAKRASELITEYKLEESITFVDIGGGFFLGNNVFSKDKPSLNSYATVIVEELSKVINPLKVRLILEPGASLLSTAVIYVCRVINQRTIRDTRVLTTDGSNLHINPFMAKRNNVCDILYAKNENRDIITKQLICGATCMENDHIYYIDKGEIVKPGDIVKCYYAGAYTMGFNNCFINLPPYIYLLQNESYKMIRSKCNNLMKLI